MRIPVALAFALLLAPAARAGCPPDCVAGGGPSATDCFVAWSGLPGMTETCADGEACDIDGKVDGVCMLGLQGCINVPGLGACTPRGLRRPHTGPPQQASGGQSLDAAVAYAQSVNAPATTGKLLRVKPGSIRASQLAHRILGQGLPRGGAVMPQGCPGFPPAGGCLTTEEIFTILSWIAAGAPDN